MSIDYRALIRDHAAKQSRPVVRHELCLVPALYADLEEAEENLRSALVASVKDEDDPDVDRRGGGVTAPDPDVAAARAVVEEIAAEMAKKSITLVFKAMTAEKQALEWDGLERAKKDNPDNVNAIVVDRNRLVLLDCFDHAEGEHREVLDLNREDVSPLIMDANAGLVIMIANKLQNASAGAPDLPKSAQRSLRNRHSNET